MQRYVADHYDSFFTCYFQPTPNYRHRYNSMVAFDARQPTQPFTSSFSIDALLGDTSKEWSQQEILPPTPRQKKSVSEKLREFEEKRRSERNLSNAMFQVQAVANANSSQAQYEEGIEPTEVSPEEGRRFVCSSLRNKRPRTMFTILQLERMEREFQRRQYITGNQRHQLAQELKLSETQVRVWFQNRRIKWRKRMTKSQF